MTHIVFRIASGVVPVRVPERVVQVSIPAASVRRVVQVAAEQEQLRSVMSPFYIRLIIS